MFLSFLKDHEELNICDNVAETIEILKKMYNVQIENLKTIGQKNMSAYALETLTYPLLSVNLNGEFYSGALTRPDLFENYYKQECMNIHSTEIKYPHESRFAISKSKLPIPLALIDEDLAAALTQEQMAFRKINILSIESVEEINGQKVRPLQWFHPTRTDYSINRLKHYTGLSAQHLQDYIIFVNYQKYLPYFVRYAQEEIAQGNFEDLIGPGDTSFVQNKMQLPEAWNDSVLLPQMPAYSLKRPNGTGITVINIGVGASNAKTIADHLSVLRPKFALMVGHCGSFMADHAIGDYIIGNHHFMCDFDNARYDTACSNIPNKFQHNFKHIDNSQKIYTGPILSMADRNWELYATKVHKIIKKCGAIGVDMESAMLVKVFEQHGINASSFLCVSDRPFHREIRLQKMAQKFYATKLEKHLLAALEIITEFAMNHKFEKLVKDGPLFR